MPADVDLQRHDNMQDHAKVGKPCRNLDLVEQSAGVCVCPRRVAPNNCICRSGRAAILIATMATWSTPCDSAPLRTEQLQWLHAFGKAPAPVNRGSSAGVADVNPGLTCSWCV